MEAIKLDYDFRPTSKTASLSRLLGRCAYLDLRPIAIRYSKSKSGNTHIVVIVSGKISAIRLVCIQLLLGSDPKREAFNYLRVSKLKRVPKFWRYRWNRLYEPPQQSRQGELKFNAQGEPKNMNTDQYMKNRGVVLENCLNLDDVPANIRTFHFTIASVKPAPASWNSPLLLRMEVPFESVKPERGKVILFAVNATNYKTLREKLGPDTDDWVAVPVRLEKKTYPSRNPGDPDFQTWEITAVGKEAEEPPAQAKQTKK